MSPPGAWYDLSSRVAQARAVAGCIGMALECRDSADRVGNLAGAVEDLLGLAEADVRKLELELSAAG